jgi:predicted NBD/HSP70 family sugar kinase
MYNKGNEIVVDNVNKNAQYLGIGISNAIKIFSPERIIIHGEVIKFGDKYLNIVRESVDKNTFPMVHEKHDIQFSQLGEYVGLMGVTYIVFESIFNLNNLDIPDHYILKRE